MRGMKERIKCLQDERELRSNRHSFVRSNSQEDKPKRSQTRQYNAVTKGETTKERRIEIDDGDDGDCGLSFLLGLVFFSVMMMVIISLSSVWGLGSILKYHGTS